MSLECARVLSKLKFPGTIIFLTVAGEEQGLNGSRHFARMAKEQGWNVEAVLNDDIVGGDKGAEQDRSMVRVFSEGIPAAASDQDLKRIRGLGGESDSPSRELARYIVEVDRSYETGMIPTMVFRQDRYLRGGDHSVHDERSGSEHREVEHGPDPGLDGRVRHELEALRGVRACSAHGQW